MRNLDDIGSGNPFLYKDESYAIIGAAMDVYYRLGCGFLEPVYQEALELELGFRGIPYSAQVKLPIMYKGRLLQKKYKADFVCFEKIIVEIKAETVLTPVDWAQILNYLKVSQLRVGLLFNFGSGVDLEKRRVII